MVANDNATKKAEADIERVFKLAQDYLTEVVLDIQNNKPDLAVHQHLMVFVIIAERCMRMLPVFTKNAQKCGDPRYALLLQSAAEGSINELSRVLREVEQENNRAQV